MPTSPSPSRKLRFGVFEVDLREAELRRSGLRQKLGPQAFELLRALLERQGELVTRDELRERLWPGDTFVDYELGLKKCVNRVREVLGDSADHPRFIETIPRRGYRFIATVTSPDSSAATEAVAGSNEKEAPQNWLRWGALAISALVLAALFVGLISYSLRQRVLKSRVPQIQSLAVIPLANLSDDPGQEYFSDGMTDALITELAQIGSIRVISRTSSMQYKQTRKSLPEIARELQVDGIVEGTVQRSGDRVRISAQLIQGPTDKHLWANSYERDLRDVFLLERDVAGDIARQVQARLNSDKRPPPAQPRPVNPAALEAYLQGNVHIHKFSRGSGDEELRLASVFFQQAIDAEPDFAPAYVGLSKARGGTLRSSSEDVDIAKRAAERAAELDPNLSDAWSALADIKCDFWDWAGAEQDYRRALALNPNDGEAHGHLGWLLDALGRLDEGWKEAEMAQQVDPNQDHLEPALDNRHEYDRIIQHIRPMLEADPDNGYLHYDLYEGYVGKGMYKEAIQHLEESWLLFGFPELAARVREAFAASGYKSAMRTCAEGLERLHVAKQMFAPMNVAGAYSAAGDKDRAFHWLEQGYRSRGRGGAGMSMVFLNRDPGLEPLRSDPRYKDLLRRIGLPQ